MKWMKLSDFKLNKWIQMKWNEIIEMNPQSEMIPCKKEMIR